MIVYHGSNSEIEKPDLEHSRKKVDFGVGFYVTPLLEQAEKWCVKYKEKGEPAIISSYTLNEAVFDQYRVLRFTSYSEEWLDFIVTCRKGMDTSDYDLVMGGVANDRVFNTVELFFDGLIEKKEAIKRLQYEQPNLQLALRSQKLMEECLHFEGSRKI